MAAKSSSHWPITLTNGAAALLNVFLPLVLVRVLTPDQIGKYSVLFLYLMCIPGLFLISGLNNGLYNWVGKYPAAKAEVRQSWSLIVLITLSLCAIGFTFSQQIALLLKIPVLDVRLLLLITPFSVVSGFLEDLMIARGNIWTGSWYGSGSSLIRAASILLAAWLTHSVEWVLGAFLLLTVARAFIGYFLLVKSGEISFVFSPDKIRNVLRYAFPVSIAGLSALALQNLDQMILSFRLSRVQFAFYAMGCLSIPPLAILEMSVNRVLIPKLSRAFAAGDTKEAATLFAESISELNRYLLPATIGLIIYAGPIVRILFTERYLPAAHFLQWYAWIYLMSALPYDAVARAKGDGKWIMWTSVLFGLLCVPATWLATGRWNAMGALIAVLCSQLLMRLYSLDYLRRSFGLPFSKFLPLGEMLIQCGLAIVASACSFLLRPLFADPRLWFLLTGPLFAVIYLGATCILWLRRLAHEPGPIHVLELSQTLCLGGLERTVYSLARTLHEHAGFKVSVATYDHPVGLPSLVSQVTEAGIPLIQWQKGNGFSVHSVIRIVRLLFSERIRILHVHDLGPLIYGSLAKIFALGRVRLVFTLHTLLDIQQNRRYRRYYKLFLHFADRIIAVSPAIQSGLIALGVDPERVEVIPNGVFFSDSPRRAPDPAMKIALRRQLFPGLSPDHYESRWLLCLARLHRGKGQDVVLDVWAELPPEVRRELTLCFVGQETQPGYVEELRQRIARFPDADRIILAGPSERPQEWIQSADVFISGSLLEGMPLAPLEAAGSGLPVLLSDIEGHRFLQSWAHFFDPIKPEDGAGKILDILATLQQNGEAQFFEDRWKAAASLREMWSAPAMTALYAETFQSA